MNQADMSSLSSELERDCLSTHTCVSIFQISLRFDGTTLKKLAVESWTKGLAPCCLARLGHHPPFLLALTTWLNWGQASNNFYANLYLQKNIWDPTPPRPRGQLNHHRGSIRLTQTPQMTQQLRQKERQPPPQTFHHWPLNPNTPMRGPEDCKTQRNLVNLQFPLTRAYPNWNHTTPYKALIILFDLDSHSPAYALSEDHKSKSKVVMTLEPELTQLTRLR